jgi:hypothetical protein
MGFAFLGAEMAYEAAALSDAAWRTHAEALIWSRQCLLDLAIPKRDLLRFAYTSDPEAATAELVLRGLWEDRGDYWYVAFHDEWQHTRDQIERRRAADQVKQSRHRKHERGDHSECLPGRCKALSPGDTPGDTPGVSREEQRRAETHLGKDQPNGASDEQRRRDIVFGRIPLDEL